jgi:anti-sigma factor RsiW
MTCREVLESIEAVAAGDEPVSAAFRSHIEGCPGCAAALATARRIEESLAARPVPAAPARFTAAVAARIRTEHWRAEQQVDRMFNVAVAVGVAAIAGGALALFNIESVMAALAVAAAVVTDAATQQGGVTMRGAPAMWTYLLAAGLLGTSLLVWRWAETPRDDN